MTQVSPLVNMAPSWASFSSVQNTSTEFIDNDHDYSSSYRLADVLPGSIRFTVDNFDQQQRMQQQRQYVNMVAQQQEAPRQCLAIIQEQQHNFYNRNPWDGDMIPPSLAAISSPQQVDRIRSFAPTPPATAPFASNNGQAFVLPPPPQQQQVQQQSSQPAMDGDGLDRLVDDIERLLLKQQQQQQQLRYQQQQQCQQQQQQQQYQHYMLGSSGNFSQAAYHPSSNQQFYLRSRSATMLPCSAPATPDLSSSPTFTATPAQTWPMDPMSNSSYSHSGGASTRPTAFHKPSPAHNFNHVHAYSDEFDRYHNPPPLARPRSATPTLHVPFTEQQQQPESPQPQQSAKACSNCGTHSSAVWRFSKLPNTDEAGKVLLCNACGLYEKRTGHKRPAGLKTHTVNSTITQRRSPVHQKSHIGRVDSMPYNAMDQHQRKTSIQLHSQQEQRELAVLRSISEPMLFPY